MKRSTEVWRTIKENDVQKREENGYNYKFVHCEQCMYDTFTASDGTEINIAFVKSSGYPDKPYAKRVHVCWYAIEMSSGLAVSSNTFETRDEVYSYLTQDIIDKVARLLNRPDVVAIKNNLSEFKRKLGRKDI